MGRKPVLNVEYRPIDALIPYARNARTHSDAQIAQLAASLHEFGWTNPVLVDGENGIIAGHGRVLAARQLEMHEIPVIELAHLTEAQKRAYVIADNKLSINAGWDEDLLASELSELKDLNFDVDLLGFTGEELAEIAWVPEAHDAPDEFPERDEGIETEHRCPKCGYEWSGSTK